VGGLWQCLSMDTINDTYAILFMLLIVLAYVLGYFSE